MTDEAVLELFGSLSNWGRWGEDDQAGTLNLVTTDVVARGAALAREGVSVSCARPLGVRRENLIGSQQLLHLMVLTGDAAPAEGQGAAADWFGIGCHGNFVTHLDAHSHIFWGGKMYNGRPASQVGAERGATAGGIEPMFAGLNSRGLLIDGPAIRGTKWLEPGDALRPAELDRWLGSHGVAAQPGDVLYVRTGRDAWEAARADVDLECESPGMSVDCLRWLREHDIAMMVSDTGHEVLPSGFSVSQPIHVVALVAMGMWLVDNASLGELARQSQASDRIEFFSCVAPIALRRSTGCPINPICIF
jgi:kynurenine formamidase